MKYYYKKFLNSNGDKFEKLLTSNEKIYAKSDENTLM